MNYLQILVTGEAVFVCFCLAVYFQRVVPYKNLSQYYQAAYFLITPSRYKDNVARVMLEATSVLSSISGALTEILNRLTAVFIYPDKNNLSNSLSHLFLERILLLKLNYNRDHYLQEHFCFHNAEIFK